MNEQAHAAQGLAVDLDTFLKADLYWDSLCHALSVDPVAALRVLGQGGDRRARLAALHQVAPLQAEFLPVREAVLTKIHAAQAKGQRVVLTGAAPEPLLADLAKAHGLDHIAAQDTGAGGENLRQMSATSEDRTGSLRPVIKALRPHQWVKNVLLFLPMIAAHAFEWHTAFAVCLGIVCFSAAASAIYVVNDLLDIEVDRQHATKSRRPFAAGTVSVPLGAGVAFGLVLGALGLAALISTHMMGVVAFYMALSFAYSMRLKRLRWADIGVLAALYTLRVVAGAAASQVDASIFMLIFVFPIFVTLGCVKRLTELTRAKTDAKLPGRGYARVDRPALMRLAVFGAIGALAIFALYSISPQAQMLYPDRWLLWVAMVPMAAWLARMVGLGYRGRMFYDPIVFALTDPRGLGYLMITLSLMFYGAGLWTQWWQALFG